MSTQPARMPRDRDFCEAVCDRKGIKSFLFGHQLCLKTRFPAEGIPRQSKSRKQSRALKK